MVALKHKARVASCASSIPSIFAREEGVAVLKISKDDGNNCWLPAMPSTPPGSKGTFSCLISTAYRQAPLGSAIVTTTCTTRQGSRFRPLVNFRAHVSLPRQCETQLLQHQCQQCDKDRQDQQHLEGRDRALARQCIDAALVCDAMLPSWVLQVINVAHSLPTQSRQQAQLRSGAHMSKQGKNCLPRHHSNTYACTSVWHGAHAPLTFQTFTPHLIPEPTPICSTLSPLLTPRTASTKDRVYLGQGGRFAQSVKPCATQSAQLRHGCKRPRTGKHRKTESASACTFQVLLPG